MLVRHLWRFKTVVFLHGVQLLCWVSVYECRGPWLTLFLYQPSFSQVRQVWVFTEYFGTSRIAQHISCNIKNCKWGLKIGCEMFEQMSERNWESAKNLNCSSILRRYIWTICHLLLWLFVKLLKIFTTFEQMSEQNWESAKKSKLL